MFVRFSGSLAAFCFIPLALAAGADFAQQKIPEGIAVCPKMVTRSEWGARNPTCSEDLHLPVKYVVIHHTHTPAACFDRQNCTAAMRSMQTFHMDGRKWCDIGYNFAVGGDGFVYEGRGWNKVGAHAPPYNVNSIGITLIGDYQKSVPNEEMINAAKVLIQCGVGTGYIAKDYKLIGHRQAKTVTECPGGALFQEIQNWPHWSPEWIHAPAATPEIKLINTISAESASAEAIEAAIPHVRRTKRRTYFGV